MKAKHTLIYPALGAVYDLFFLRLSGHGLGNCFYNYFHAVTLAQRVGARVISPPWLSVKIGPLLRGERTKRTYWGLFRPLPAEIHGLKKLLTLLIYLPTCKRITISADAKSNVGIGRLNIVRCNSFTFKGLHEYRANIRHHLLAIMNHSFPINHPWGNGGFVAIHIRLGGDFARVTDAAIISSGKANIAIPLAWYTAVAQSLREQYPHKKIYVFSDGNASELKPLLELGAEIYSSGSDVEDLLKMATASILVGSNSTYSRWAAFLGDMPSIWLKKEVQEEKPSGDQTPIAYVPLNNNGNILWA